MTPRVNARIVFALILLAAARVISAAETAGADDTGEWPAVEGEGITVPAHPLPTHGEPVGIDPAASSRAIDLSEVLAREAGLALTSYGGYGMASGLNARGFSSARVRVYLDGIPLNSRQSGEADLSWIDASSLNAASIEYGTGAGGILRLSTVDDSYRGLTWSAGASNLSWLPPRGVAGLADTQRLSFSAKRGTESLRWNAGAFGTRAANRFPYGDESGGTAYRESSGVLDAGFRAGISFPLSRDASLAAAVSGYVADKNVPGSTGSASSGRQEDSRARESVLLSLRDGDEARYDAEVALAHSFSSVRWRDPAGVTRNAVNSLDLAARVSRYAGDAHAVRFLTEASYVACDSDSIGRKSLASATAGLALDSRFPGRLSTRAELRAVAPSGGDGWTAIPVVAVFKGVGDASRLGISAFRAHKRPDLNALYWSGDPTASGNPDLRSEDGWGGELFAGLSSGTSVRTSHSAYVTWYRNAVSWTANSGVWTPENMGEALFVGTDHSARFTPADGLTFEIFYSFLRTWVLTGDFGFTDGKRIPYQPEHRVSLALKGARSGWTWRVAPRYEGARFVSVMNVATLPGFFVLDIGLAKRIGKSLEVSIEVQNALSESYATVEGYPMPGASVSLGAVYTYR